MTRSQFNDKEPDDNESLPDIPIEISFNLEKEGTQKDKNYLLHNLLI